MLTWNWSATPKRGSAAKRRALCLTCAKMIVNVGIRRMIFAGDYPDPLAVEMLSDAGVTIERLSLEPLVPGEPR